MKIIIPFFMSLFLAAMSFAQEESPAPAESTAPATEEKASATVETTPTAAPAEASSPAAQKSEQPKAAKKETTATTAAATKPATAAAPAASNAKMSGKNMSVKDMENAWEAAVPKHDFATVEGFVAADFTGVSSKGKFVNRADMLSDYKKDKDTYKSAKNEKLNVKMLGPNVAIVTGRAREVGTGKDAKAFDRTFLFTDTWMMRGGKWQCVASQVTKIKG